MEQVGEMDSKKDNREENVGWDKLLRTKEAEDNGNRKAVAYKLGDLE